MAKSESVGEQVRLPGIINMDLEATKIRTLDEACGVVTEEKMLHLNIPLQISVDTKALNPSGVYSPSVTKQSRGSSTEDRGRIPSSTLQPRSRTPSGRIRSASVGRGDKKQEMAARYWAVLFENLRRAVDDLYRTCEGDESAVAAKEVLMVLENYVKDFKNLINWLKLNTEFEKTPAPSRPTSLTWDIRKTSPAGRNTPTGSGKLTPTRQLLLCSPAKRQLNFDEKEENRSRTVSETIKESNREHEMSPSSEPAVEQQIEPDINIEDIEIDANVSEHEKSDSEQEKNKDVDEISEPDNDKDNEKVINESDSKSSTDPKEAKSEEKSTKESENKSTDLSNESKEMTNETTIVKAVDNTTPKKEKLTESQKKEKDNKPEPRPGIKSCLKEKSTTGKESSSRDKLSAKISTNKDKPLSLSAKPAGRPMLTNQPTAAVAKTTFASTLKKGGVSGGVTRAGNAPLTRALTTMSGTGANRPPPSTRKNTAGLLITSQKLQDRKTDVNRMSGPNRISLVARQAQFALQSNQQRRNASSANSRHKDKLYPPTSSSASGNKSADSSNIPYGSTTSINSGSSSRSWADTVKGASEVRTHTSAEDISSKGLDEDGWRTVRRARSRFSQASSGSQASLKTKGQRQGLSKMKNRYNLPSSAVSMPSLASMEISREQEAQPAKHTSSSRSSGHPTLEKSASSASIVRNRDARITRLGSVSERTVAGSSADSIQDEDPSYIKKKKDEMNQSKQRILKKSNSTPHSRKGSGQDGGGKGNKGGSHSTPQSRKASDNTKTGHADTIDDDHEEEEKIEAIDDLKSGIDLGQETDVDTDNEEIRQRDEAIAKAESDAAQLQRELRETEQSELTDTDVETDTIGTEDSCASEIEETKSTSTRSEVAESILEGLSWAEQMELEEQLSAAEAVEARLPGRAIHLHEKLSSPARKKEPHETFKHYQEKQDKARLRRQMFSEEKAIKLAQLNQKINEVLEQRDKLVDERKTMIEHKLRKAEEKRIQHIEGIRRKAHEEEEKLKEIAFINELQAQNARIDMITQVSNADEKCEERLAVLAEEKAKKAEQREEREARAEERRREIEEARQRNLEAMISRRKEREERIQGSQAAAREKRKVSARQKDKERLEKLSFVRAAETDMKEELKEKIQQKQEDAAKRHAEYLEDIRQKAFELSVQKCSNDEGVPIIKPYENKKKCQICNVLIRSEVHLQSHLRGKKHIEELEKNSEGKKMSGEEITDYNIKQIIDAPEGETDPITIKAKERVKHVKRRAKKLKVKLEVKGEEYTQSLSAPNRHLDSPHRAKIGKSIRDIDKLLNNQGKGAWSNQAVSQLERALGEISRSFDKNFAKDQDVFFNLGGYDVFCKIYDKVLEFKGGNMCPIPIKAIVSCGKVMLKSINNHQGNCEFLLLSNRVIKFIELLRSQLTRLMPDTQMAPEFDINPGPETDPIAKSLMQFLSVFIFQLSKSTVSAGSKTRLQDLLSYIVSIETVDTLSGYFQLVRNPIDSSPEVADFLLVALQFLSSLTGGVHINGEAHTLLLTTLQWTELAGTVSLLYGMLLHQGRDTARDAAPPPLPTHTLAVASETCTLLERLVSQNLIMVQGVLASEGISLEFRHIVSYLLWYSHCHNHTPLLNQVIVLVGYFTANHADNQTIVQEGSQPSVLQQLANLPFQYFSQTELKNVLFPTLLSCCHNNAVNMEILTTEMSWQLIEDYIKTPEAKNSQLVSLILPDK